MKSPITLPSEKVLEDLTFELIKEATIHQIGLNLGHGPSDTYKAHRQVNLSNYGIADIVLVCNKEFDFIATVVELKNVAITSKDINQVLRYRTALQRMEIFTEVKAVLVGTEISDGHYILNECSDFLDIYTFEVDALIGLRFENIGTGFYVKSDTTNAENLLQIITDEEVH